MENIKEQINKFFIKVKSDRSLQVKIALVVGVLLLYHFLFGDIGNRNVEIESITQEITNRDSLYSYSVFLEKDRLKVHEYSWSDLSVKYCKGIADYYTIRRVVSFEPMIVECRAGNGVYKVVVTDGEESHTLDYTTKGNERFRHIKDDELQIPKNSQLTVAEIEDKYCKKHDLKLRKILESNPMKVVCGYPDSAKKTYATNGKWVYLFENYNFGIEGQNEQYLIRDDFSLVDKSTGKTYENTIKVAYDIDSYKKLHIIGVATVSKNKRFFVSQYHDWGDSVAEVDKNGKITKLQEFYTSLSLNIPHVKAIISSDDGSYLYVLIEKTQRGPNNHLMFYIIDVKSKSIIFKKTLERNKVSFYNIFMKKQDGFILIFYEVGFSLKALKITHKIK